MSCKSSVTKIAAEFSLTSSSLDSFVFLPLSTRVYFKGTGYIKIILKNHVRSYFAGVLLSRKHGSSMESIDILPKFGDFFWSIIL